MAPAPAVFAPFPDHKTPARSAELSPSTSMPTAWSARMVLVSVAVLPDPTWIPVAGPLSVAEGAASPSARAAAPVVEPLRAMVVWARDAAVDAR